MTRPMHITSKSNGRLRDVRRLARRRAPDRFVIDGHRALRCALTAGNRVLEVYAAPDLFLGDRDAELIALAARRGALVHHLSADAFRSVSGQVRADGLLAVVERPSTTLRELGEFVVVADGIERPGNLGTVIRTAAAAGADSVVACDVRTDVFHPEVVRGSVGAIFNVRVGVASTADAVARLRRHRVVVATPDASIPFWSADYRGVTAVVVGSERHGVSAVWRRAAAQNVAIPLAEGADSLNVAVAAGVILIEAARQRALPGSTR
jgi:TrmH family RNA methyltransferase